MIGLIIRLILLLLVIYFIYRVFRKLLGTFKGGAIGGASPFAKAEACPSCQSFIRVPAEPGACPKCGTPLGRSPDGKLLIKVN